MINPARHQYIDRASGRVVTESLYRNGFVTFLYSEMRERASWCFNLLTSPRSTALLGYMNFDISLRNNPAGVRSFVRNMGIDLGECIDTGNAFQTVRQIFERKIRYWQVRPMSGAPGDIVSPADARVLVGSMNHLDHLYIKGKYFTFPELLGSGRGRWGESFHDGDVAVFRLTPEQYHYNHVPVSGMVKDIYEVHGRCHACNPGAVIREVTPYSKNQRVVTVIDTDVDGGSRVGLVAMIEVTAMMIGQVVQCYSESRYDDPCGVTPGVFVAKGCPKSLFRPGSSTVILLFQRHRTSFCRDLVDNMSRRDAGSMFARGFGLPVVETGVRVRETVAQGVACSCAINENEEYRQ